MNSNHRVFGAENESRTFGFVGRARSFVRLVYDLEKHLVRELSYTIIYPWKQIY